MGIRCQATYRALFKRDNDVGVHHWIEIKEPEKSTLFTKQEEGLWEECMSRSRQGYYRLQKKISYLLHCQTKWSASSIQCDDCFGCFQNITATLNRGIVPLMVLFSIRRLYKKH